MLNAIQQACYLDTVDVWRKPPNVNATTKHVSDGVWAPVIIGLKCVLETTQNDDDDAGIARVKRRSALTEDDFYCESGTDIRSQDLVILTTPGDPRRYTVERVEGAPKDIPSQGVWDVNELSVKVFEDEHPPAEIKAYYGITDG